jgi:hypothetical protein
LGMIIRQSECREIICTDFLEKLKHGKGRVHTKTRDSHHHRDRD